MAATIKLGSVGSDVSTWQGLLASAGFPSSDPSGTFGPSTDAQTKAWQSAKGLTSDGIVGPMSWGAMTGTASAGVEDKNAQYGRDALVAAWAGVTGEQPSLAELQFVGANARLESGYGKAQYKLLDHATGQTLATSGVINNWGAVQGGASDGTGFLATDTSPLKVTTDNPHGYYDHHYRIYATPAEGAADMIKQMTVRRPTAWALIKQGDIDAALAQLHAGYENGKLKVDPVTNVPGYFEQDPKQRAVTIEKYISQIAFTLHEPIAAKRGGPVAPGEVVGPGGVDESGSASRPLLIAGGLTAAAALAWRIWQGRWPWPF
jgi:peptidoglycan hydrolase-like protein with peptidoglycan-binding domain